MRGFVHKRTHKRKDGKLSVLYYAVIDTTVPGSTRRTQNWGKGYSTRKEADRALRDRLTAFETQTFVHGTKLTVASYLLDHWLPLIKDRVKPTTFDSYRRAIETYVIAPLGALKLQELSPMHLNHLYADLRERGGYFRYGARAGERRPLSPKTVRNLHVILSKALNDAVDDGLVVTNVAQRAKPPRQRGRGADIQAWAAEELSHFLDHVRDDRYYFAWHVSAHTGLRRGELLGLRWQDVDFAARRLSVRQAIVPVGGVPTLTTPKSHEARVVDLDQSTLEVLWRRRTTEALERRAWGEGYLETGLIVRREDGHTPHPDWLSQLFARNVHQSGIRRISLHGLRHTHATLMLQAGVPVKVVSERLGHADPAFTLRIYQHVLSGMQAQAAAAFADFVRGAMPPVLAQPASIIDASTSPTSATEPDR